jgi:hypothetical protein
VSRNFSIINAFVFNGLTYWSTFCGKVTKIAITVPLFN